MEEKRKVIILVTIALILAATAIILNVLDSTEEIPTSTPSTQNTPIGGEVGVKIQPPVVEDKLIKNTSQK